MKIIVCLIVLVLIAPIVAKADVPTVIEDIRQYDLYPESLTVHAGYNPDKNRDWTFHEVGMALAWKFKNKWWWFMPDGFKCTVDYTPDKNRCWTFHEITGAVTWKLK